MTYLSHDGALLFRFSHRARFIKAAELIDAGPGQLILDYGCADGRLLKMLMPSGARLIGFDPSPEMQKELREINGIEVVIDTADLESNSCDAISVCEVFEHISAAAVDRILGECRRLLKPQGKLIVSVPIEVGPSALVKSLARWIGVRPLERNLTVANVLRSTCYLPVRREVDSHSALGPVYGHMGFDYRKLRLPEFKITATIFSPLQFGPLLNSQVFFVAKAE